MDNTVWLDWLAAGVAIAIVVAGLLMLIRGVSAMNKQ